MKYVADQHPVTFDAPDRLKASPALGPKWHEEMAALKDRLAQSSNLTAIFSMLVTGYLPWGVDWDHNGEPFRLPWCGGSRTFREPARYIMCCGHTLSPKRAQECVSAGLLDAGPLDRHGRASLIITPAGRDWLLLNWRAVS